MTKAKTLCELCRHYDVSVEIRDHKVTEAKTCDYWHQWVGRVVEPKQCRDYKYHGEATEC